MGAAAAALLDVVDPAVMVADAAEGAMPNVVDGAGMPDVRGFADALEAPEKAGDPPEAEGLGIALVMFGFKTLLAISCQPPTNNTVKESLLVNHMHHAVRDQDVWRDDLGAVDEDVAVFKCDG